MLLRDTAPTRDTVELTLADGDRVEVLRVRDSRARRLRLIVNERGVRLTLPRRASERLAAQFLDEQRGWLQLQLQRFAALRPAAALSLEARDALPLRGEEVPLIRREARFVRITRHEHGIELAAPAGLPARRLDAAMREFYLAEARADLGRWLPAYLPGLPRPPSQFRIRPLRSLWGSLAPNGALSLDLALVLGRPAAFEYVLVHELCHLLQANHSSAFWREVERRCPDWRTQRDYLRGDGLALKRELGALLGTASR